MKRILIILTCLILTNIACGQDNYLLKGNQFIIDKNYADAEKIFKEAIKSDSSNIIYQAQLALALLKQTKYTEAQKLIDTILSKDSAAIGALWYGGINNFSNKKASLRTAVVYFEKAIKLLQPNEPQLWSGNWYIGRAYHILLQTDGLKFEEVSRMIECYSTYLRLQPNADDYIKISEFIQHIKEIRPPDNVKIWINKPK